MPEDQIFRVTREGAGTTGNIAYPLRADIDFTCDAGDGGPSIQTHTIRLS